jgi:pyrimidine deaminase RibD-like protein
MNSIISRYWVNGIIASTLVISSPSYAFNVQKVAPNSSSQTSKSQKIATCVLGVCIPVNVNIPVDIPSSPSPQPNPSPWRIEDNDSSTQATDTLTVNLESCVRKGRIVRCSLVVTSNSDTTIYLYTTSDTKAVDTDGTEYFVNRLQIGKWFGGTNTSVEGRLIKDIRYKTQIEFAEIPASVSQLALLKLRGSYLGNSTGYLNFRRIPIQASSDISDSIQTEVTGDLSLELQSCKRAGKTVRCNLFLSTATSRTVNLSTKQTRIVDSEGTEYYPNRFEVDKYNAGSSGNLNLNFEKDTRYKTTIEFTDIPSNASQAALLNIGTPWGQAKFRNIPIN